MQLQICTSGSDTCILVEKSEVKVEGSKFFIQRLQQTSRVGII